MKKDKDIKNKINASSFIVILSPMTEVLHLSGNELIVFALIHGFSQDGKSRFYGDIDYISKRVNVSYRSVKNILNKLTEKHFLDKKSETKGVITKNSYASRYYELLGEETAPVLGEEIAPVAGEETAPVAGEETAPIKEIYKINNNTPASNEAGVAEKENKYKIGYRGRLIFEDYYKAHFGVVYYWTAKESTAMIQLLKKIKFTLEASNLPTDDDACLKGLQGLLDSITNKWLIENMSVAIVSSHYNEIEAQARRTIGFTCKTDTNVTTKKRIHPAYEGCLQ